MKDLILGAIGIAICIVLFVIAAAVGNLIPVAGL